MSFTCIHCKHCYVEDLYHLPCCDLRSSVVPVTKYGNSFTKCKKFQVSEDFKNEVNK